MFDERAGWTILRGRPGSGSPWLRWCLQPTAGRPAVHGFVRSAALATAALMAHEVSVPRFQSLGVPSELQGELRPQQSLHPHGVEHLLRRGIARALLRDDLLRLADGLQRLVVGPGHSGPGGITCSRSTCLRKAWVLGEVSKPKSSAMVPAARLVDSLAPMVTDVAPIATSCD